MSISLLGLLLGVILLRLGYGKLGDGDRKLGYIVAGWLILGVQLLVIFGIMIPSIVGPVAWIEHKPTSWLLSEVESPTGLWPADEYAELVKRLEEGSLSDKELKRLVPVAMARYVATGKALENVEVSAVNRLRKAGKLSDNQTDCFFEQVIKLQMKANLITPREGAVPVSVAIRPHGDWSKYDLWCVATVTPKRTSDDRTAERSLTRWSSPSVRFARLSRNYGGEISVRVVPLGDSSLVMQGPAIANWHTTVFAIGTDVLDLSCDVSLAFFDEDPSGGASAKPIHTRAALLSATSRIVTPETAAVQLLKDYKYAPEVRGPDSPGPTTDRWRIACHHFDVVPSPTGDSLRLAVRISSAGGGSPNVGAAFNVSVTIDGKAYDAGTICHNKYASWAWIVTVPYPLTKPETVSLTLTPSAELAARSVDLGKIWGEVVRIEYIPWNKPIVVRPHIVN